MDDGDADARDDSLGAFVRQLIAELRWEPDADAAKSDANDADKRAFVEALTAIAALPLDSVSMEVRRLLVAPDEHEGGANDGEDATSAPLHLLRVVAALEARDVLLKCKAASAIGSLCVSRVAGQRLLDAVGGRVLASLSRMAACKNQWAQADALFVLGWVVVIADEEMLAAVAALLPSVLKLFHRNLRLLLSTQGAAPSDQKTAALVTSEQATNFRVYSLVLLLNLCQRDPGVFHEHVDALAETLVDVLHVLVVCYPDEDTDESECQAVAMDASEFAELLRLAVTILSLLVGALGGLCERLLELKAVPLLLKLRRMADAEGDSTAESDPDEDDDLAERLTALVGAVLAAAS